MDCRLVVLGIGCPNGIQRGFAGIRVEALALNEAFDPFPVSRRPAGKKDMSGLEIGQRLPADPDRNARRSHSREALRSAAPAMVGRAVSDVLLAGGTRWLTWAFVAFFVIVATGLDKRLRIPVAGAWMANALGGQDAVFARAALLGTLTPFIPCGPLYLMLAASALAGSAWAGAAVMAAFAVGTVPLILGIQSQFFRMGARISPVGLERLRRALAAVSVAVLIYRGLGDPAVMCQ